MNRMRSSRQLEKECYRNLEVMWLMRGLAPDHNTISNFRKENPDAIKKVFRATVELARNFELIGGKLLAGDGSVFRSRGKDIDAACGQLANKNEAVQERIFKS